MTPDRHHRWRIRLASGSKQAARATPTARSACFVPHPADQDFTHQMTFHCHPQKRAPRSFQSRNLTEVSIFSTILPHFQYSSVRFHLKSDRGVGRPTGYKKNETRHSREAPHTNHIINNTKTNNRVQRYGHSVNPQ